MNQLLGPDRPDWRWARVADLTQYSHTAALARLQREDELTRLVYDFRRALDRGMEEDYPELAAAYDLYMNHKQQRMLVEGLMLAGASNDKLCEYGFFNDKLLNYYHDVFFWVRPGLDKPIWLNAVIFGGMPHINAHHKDVTGTVHRLAWKLGADIFAELLKRGLSSDMNMIQVRSLAAEVLTTQLAMLSFSAGSGRDLPEWGARVLDFAKDQKPGSDSTDIDSILDTLLGKDGISVADPTIQDNLSLPARELRAHEYSVQGGEQCLSGA